MSSRIPSLSAALAIAALLLLTAPSHANERHFTNNYETAVLAPGVVEIEAWATARLGRERFYSAIDNRLEFELGLTDRLQTSLYMNFGAEGVRSAAGITSGANHKGISSEWKYKMSDSVADALGSALYLELSLGPDEVEVESKILIDKRVGPWNFVVNGIYEFEHNYAEAINEHKVHGTAGLGYFVNEHMSVGLEAMDFNVIEAAAPGGANELRHGALYAGPVLSYGANNWWTAISVTPQLYGYGKAVAAGSHLDLEDFEKVQGRILFGVHL